MDSSSIGLTSRWNAGAVRPRRAGPWGVWEGCVRKCYAGRVAGAEMGLRLLVEVSAHGDRGFFQVLLQQGDRCVDILCHRGGEHCAVVVLGQRAQAH